MAKRGLYSRRCIFLSEDDDDVQKSPASRAELIPRQIRHQPRADWRMCMPLGKVKHTAQSDYKDDR